MSDVKNVRKEVRKKVKEYILETLKEYGIDDIKLAEEILSKSTLEEHAALRKFVSDIVAARVLGLLSPLTLPAATRRYGVCEEIIELLRRKYEIEEALSRLDEEIKESDHGEIDYKQLKRTLMEEINKIEDRLKALVMG